MLIVGCVRFWYPLFSKLSHLGYGVLELSKQDEGHQDLSFLQTSELFLTHTLGLIILTKICIFMHMVMHLAQVIVDVSQFHEQRSSDWKWLRLDRCNTDERKTQLLKTGIIFLYFCYVNLWVSITVYNTPILLWTRFPLETMALIMLISADYSSSVDR